MEGAFYTHASWRVRPGEEEAFVRAWSELGDIFSALPGRPLWGTLIRSTTDPALFYSFGPWRSADDVAAMRADPAAQRAIERVRSHCVEASPEGCELVRHVGVQGAPPAPAG